MKHVKRYFILLAIICVVGIGLTRPQIQEWIEGYRIGQRAHEINQKGFTVLLDGEPIDTTNVQMSKSLHLLMPIADVVKYFGASVMIDEQGVCYVQGEHVPQAAVVPEARTPENILIDIHEVASLLGISYAWNDSEMEAALNTYVQSELPRSYDLRDHMTLSPASNQGDSGTCWAFASTTALETSVSDGEIWNFSVDHMTMNSGFNISPTQGGDYNMAIAYLSAWQGPVSESDDPYGDGVTDTSLTAEKHLQEAQIFNEKDLDYIKRMVMTYGGVESQIHMSIHHAWDVSEDYQPINSAYYYSGDMKANHDVVIVGWDDDFSRENFKRMPERDGAFICRNSWGEEFGNHGYFYVSYEDAVLGTGGVVYTRVENPDNYSTIYQSDMLGWVGTLGYNAEEAWFANVYKANDDEDLDAISFYATDGATEYDIYVVPVYTEPDDLKQPIYVGSGYFDQGGYYTVDLPESVHLTSGDQFAVIVCITTENCERPIAIEYQASDLTSGAVISDGEGYVSHDGQHWTSTEKEYNCNVCLKAFTS